MEYELNHLGACIDRQLDLYRRLSFLLQDERKAILASDLEALNRVILEKEDILQTIRSEEVARREVASELASLLGMEAGTLTITRLSDRLADSPPATRLKEKGVRLQSLIEQIRIESDRNGALCLHALQFVNNSLRLLTSLTRPSRVYQASGRVQGDSYTGRMVSGAV